MWYSAAWIGETAYRKTPTPRDVVHLLDQEDRHAQCSPQRHHQKETYASARYIKQLERGTIRHEEVAHLLHRIKTLVCTDKPPRTTESGISHWYDREWQVQRAALPV